MIQKSFSKPYDLVICQHCYDEGCDSLIAVHRILCRATKINNIRIGKQTYLSVVPLNQKFNL